MNLAERYPPTLELAQAYSEHAPGMSLIGYYSRGIALRGEVAGTAPLVQRSMGARAVAEFLRHSLARGLAVHDVRGEVARGRAAPAADRRLLGNEHGPLPDWRPPCSAWASTAKHCKRPAACTSPGWNWGTSRWRASASICGPLPPPAGCRKTSSRLPWRCKRSDAQGTTQVLLADGVRLMALGRYEEAEARFTRGPGRRPPRRNDERLRGAEPGLVGHRAALPGREAAALRGPSAPCALGRAAMAARRALRTARWLQNDRPHALREYGRILALQGKTRRALRCFAKSLAVAQRQGAKYEHAQTQLADGQLRQLLGQPGAEQQVAEALAALSAIAVPAGEIGIRRPRGPAGHAFAGRPLPNRAGGRPQDRIGPVADDDLRGGPQRGPAVAAGRTLPGAGDRAEGRPGVLRAGGGECPARFPLGIGAARAGGGPGRDRCRRQSRRRRPRRCLRRGTFDPLRSRFRPRPRRGLHVRGTLPGAIAVRPGRAAAGRLHRHDRRRRAGECRGFPAVARPQRDPGNARRRTDRRRGIACPGTGPLQSRTGTRGQRVAAGRRTVARRQGIGRNGQPRQERIPGHDEPRDPHAHERRAGHDGTGALHAAELRAEGLPQHRQAIGRLPAAPDQRHPRFLQDRGGQDGIGAHRLRSPRGGRRRHPRARAPRRAKRGWSWSSTSMPACRCCCRAIPAACGRSSSI